MMNYEELYKTLKTKLQALAGNATIRLPNELPADDTDLDIDVSISEVDSNIYTEKSMKRDISIDLSLSVPISTGTQRIHHIASRIVAAFDPLHKGNFWTDGHGWFIRIRSAGQRQANMTKTC